MIRIAQRSSRRAKCRPAKPELRALAVGILTIGLVLHHGPLLAQANGDEQAATADDALEDGTEPGEAGAADADEVPRGDGVQSATEVERDGEVAGSGSTGSGGSIVRGTSVDESQGATTWQEASAPTNPNTFPTNDRTTPLAAPDGTATGGTAPGGTAPGGTAPGGTASDPTRERYPLRIGLRPLTMPRRMLRIDGSYTLFRFLGEPPDFASIVRLGIAYGVTDWLELSFTDQQLGRRRLYTAGLVPLTFSSGFNFGDLYASARFRFVRGPRFTLGIDVGFIIPTDTNFAILTALPFRARSRNGVFSLDGSLEIGLFLGGGLVVSTPLTLSPRVSPIEALTLGIDTGFSLGDAFEGNRITVPLGFEASYSVHLGRHLLDAFVNFAMPDFLVGEYSPTSDSRERTIQADQWALTVGVRSYLDLN